MRTSNRRRRWVSKCFRRSAALRVTERFLRHDFGHLEIQITIEDSKAYKKPFTVTQDLNLLADTEMLEYFCSENERDVRHFVVK